MNWMQKFQKRIAESKPDWQMPQPQAVSEPTPKPKPDRQTPPETVSTDRRKVLEWKRNNPIPS